MKPPLILYPYHQAEVRALEAVSKAVDGQTLVGLCLAMGVSEKVAQQALNSLSDKGLIYEPELGLFMAVS